MYTEEELLEGCKKGKASFQEALYKKYASRMRYTCQRYAKTSFEVEDIFQEGFIKVLTNLDKYKGGGSLDGWIRRIFVNSAIDYYRKNMRFDDQVLIGNEEYTDVVDDEEESIIEKLAEKFSKEELLELVSSLPDGYRLVFNLFVIEGYSHNQIAESLNITTGTSKSQLAKARKMLKSLISEQLTKQNKTIELVLEQKVIKLGVSA